MPPVVHYQAHQCFSLCHRSLSLSLSLSLRVTMQQVQRYACNLPAPIAMITTSKCLVQILLHEPNSYTTPDTAICIKPNAISTLQVFVCTSARCNRHWCSNLLWNQHCDHEEVRNATGEDLSMAAVGNGGNVAPPPQPPLLLVLVVERVALLLSS
jgi:hypothetical protein